MSDEERIDDMSQPMRVSGGAFDVDERVRERERVLELKGRELIEVLVGFGFTREVENAIARAEEAVMWGLKHIRR